MIGWCAVAAASAVGEGAAAYREGQLDVATATWEAGLGRQASGVLMYNLGTVWLRRGDPARAAAYLRGAAALRPRDGSVHHNLALARSELGAVPPPAESAVAWSLVVTPGELGLFSVVLAGIGSAVLLGGLRRDGWTLPGATLWVGGVAAGAVASAGAWEQWRHPIAVVVDQPAALRDAASMDGRARVELPVGAEVRIERSYAGFFLVEDGKGRRGWVGDGAVVVPHPFP